MLFVATSIPGVSHAGHKDASLVWLRYTEGVEVAKKENKPALIYFFASWCGYCKKMESEVFTDHDVEAEMQKFVLIRVDIDSDKTVVHEGKVTKESDLARSHGVTGTPTIRFQEPDGKDISGIPGFLDQEKFVTILKYINEGAYKKMRFSDYLKRWEQGK